jgi:hypothetical protein
MEAGQWSRWGLQGKQFWPAISLKNKEYEEQSDFSIALFALPSGVYSLC